MKAFLFLFFAVNFLTAQKVVKKSILAKEVSSFQIDAANCFAINMETIKGDAILVEAKIDGEYRNDLDLKVLQEGNAITVGAGFRSNFNTPNDKLSAHKVVSISLNIKLPKQKYVTVFGRSCNVNIGGVYQNLSVTLSDGTCTLNNVSETIEVKTQSGDIYVSGRSGIVNSTSKYGKITGDKIPEGNTKYELSTVTGDIFVTRIE